jgi:hypothetical protein
MPGLRRRVLPQDGLGSEGLLSTSLPLSLGLNLDRMDQTHDLVTFSGYSSNQYVIVGGNPGTCASDYFSATPSQVFAATAFLRRKQPNSKVVDPTIAWVATP